MRQQAAREKVWCTEEGQSRFRDMKGDVGEIGCMASNTVVWDEGRDTRDNVLRGLAEYTRKITHMSLGWRGIKFPMTWKPYRYSFALTLE